MRERDEDADDVAVEPAREQHEPALARSGRRPPSRRSGVWVRDELEREHRRRGRAPRRLCELRPAMSSSRVRRRPPSSSARASEARRVGSSSSTAIAPRRHSGLPPNVPPRPPGGDGVHDLGAAGDAGERQSAAERLAGDEQVGLDAVVLDRPQRPGAADAGLHLVVDVEDPVLARRSPAARREVGRHGDEAALALHRLEHHAGDRRRVDVLLEAGARARRSRPRCRPAVRVRRRRAVDVGRERAEALLVRTTFAVIAMRQDRAAVEGAVEDDDAGPAGRGARDLDRVLDRLGARVDEQPTSVAASPGERSSSRRQTSTYGSYIPTMKHWWRYRSTCSRIAATAARSRGRCSGSRGRRRSRRTRGRRRPRSARPPRARPRAAASRCPARRGARAPRRYGHFRSSLRLLSRQATPAMLLSTIP